MILRQFTPVVDRPQCGRGGRIGADDAVTSSSVWVCRLQTGPVWSKRMDSGYRSIPALRERSIGCYSCSVTICLS